MQEIQVNKTKNYTVPVGSDKLVVTHEWGDVILTATDLSGTYSYTPNSVGILKFDWMNGTNLIKRDYYSSYMPLVTSSEFFADYSELEDQAELFPSRERRVRLIVQGFTGQVFGPYTGITLEIPGDGGEYLQVPVRIRNITGINDNFGEALTEYVEAGANSEWFLERKSSLRYYNDIKSDFTRSGQDLFTTRLNFTVTGDFGWEWVPQDVQEAAKLLIADDFNNSNDLRNHGINEAQLGDFSYKLNADQAGTTGNTQADLLLSPYVTMNIGLI